MEIKSMTSIEFRVFQAKVTRAIKKAVREAIAEHWRNGDYVVVMQDGKIMKLNPPRTRASRGKSSRR
jgi:hypothetical protein